MWELGQFRITRSEMREMLGEPDFVETDSTRTYGGEEDVWAFALESRQRTLVVLRVPYHMAVFSADPPNLEPLLDALKISPNGCRLVRFPKPVLIA